MIRAGIIGASGYLGAELLRLLSFHEKIQVTLLQGHTNAGVALGEIYPSLDIAYKGLIVSDFSPEAIADLDLLFVSLPAGVSAEVMDILMSKVPLVVDLGADFRLKDISLYEKWYHFKHQNPDLADKAVYGLPEFYRSDIKDATLISSPGCYVTAAALAIKPFVQAGIFEKDACIIVDGASGTSGAGRQPTKETHHSYVNENFRAYGLLDHRHTPEMEQVIGRQILFTPHLVPMTRGILVTCYAKANQEISDDETYLLQADYYQKEPFVEVIKGLPSTKDSYGSNIARLTARYDKRTGYVVMLGAIDNLTKGGAGQAIQSANIALGIKEDTGLTQIGVIP